MTSRNGDDPTPAALLRWEPIAQSSGKGRRRPRLPVHVVTSEAAQAAAFFQRRWEPSTGAGGQPLPGLVSVEGKSLPAHTGQDILELIEAVGQAETRRRFAARHRGRAPVREAHAVAKELRAVLAWHLEGRRGQRASAARLLVADTRAARTHDALAAALGQLATVADEHRAAIDGLGGFELRTIDRARALSDALLRQSAGPAVADPGSDPLRLTEARDRLITLLERHVAAVRNAARFVFRDHPQIVREATSAYERARRGQSRASGGAQSSQPSQ